MRVVIKRVDREISLAGLLKMLPPNADHDKIMITPCYDAFAMYDYEKEAYIRIEQVD